MGLNHKVHMWKQTSLALPSLESCVPLKKHRGVHIAGFHGRQKALGLQSHLLGSEVPFFPTEEEVRIQL